MNVVVVSLDRQSQHHLQRRQQLIKHKLLLRHRWVLIQQCLQQHVQPDDV
jgi:hypothetical protein